MQEVVIRSHELDLSREKIELIKQTVAKGASDLELEMFFHACKRTGLDPLMKQVYAIKRWNSQENKQTMTIQTGIDGYRLIADRTGCYAGSSDAEYELNDEGYPGFAKVTVTKLVNGMPCQFTASARWKEYCQLGKDGQPTAMWKRMPFLMLGKCAEALALRKAFPAELSGLYTHEEMQQADEQKPIYTDHKRTVAQKMAELTVEGIQPEAQAAGIQMQQSEASSPQTSDIAPPAQSLKTMNAANTCQQFRLCESMAELADIMNQWQAESHLHALEDREQVNKVFHENKKRVGKR